MCLLLSFVNKYTFAQVAEQLFFYFFENFLMNCISGRISCALFFCPRRCSHRSS